MSRGLQITKGTSEVILNISTVKLIGTDSASWAATDINRLTSSQVESIKDAVEAYVPSGSGGSYDEGYADGEAAMESAIESSQASVAGQYKSKLASEDATIAAADSTSIDGQGTIFTESYSYLKTSTEIQNVYDDGYDDGETAGYTSGYSAGEAAGEAAGYANGQSAAASSQATVASQYKTKLSSEDADIAAADASTLSGQGTIFSESYQYLKTSAEMQANYNSGYTAGETAGYTSGYSAGETAGEATGKAAIATSQQPVATDYKSLLSSVDQTIAAADPTTLAGQLSIFNESYQYLNTGGGSGTPFTKDNFVSEWQYFESDGFWQHKGVSYYTRTSGNNRGQYEADGTYVWRIHSWNNNVNGNRIWHGPSGNAYYSASSTQYVLNEQNMEWVTVSWSGFSSFNGEYIWHDSLGNVYFSNGADQYILDEQNMTWSAVSWNGFSTPSGYYIWNGPSGKAYYSNGSAQYVLNEQNMEWVTITWTGVPSFYGIDTFTDSLGIVRLLLEGYGLTSVYILDESTYTFSFDNWTLPESYSGGGRSIFKVGTTLLYHRTGYVGNYTVDTVNKTFTSFEFYTYTTTPPAAIYSNGTVYDLDDINMSFKPKSNNP